VISLASVPAGHPYVHAVLDPEHVALLSDPVPPGATVPGQWWPPRLLDPAFLADHIGDIDVLHVHFGFDSTPPGVLRDVVAVLREHEVPLVVTVHDLDNPHFRDPAEHRERLGVLISSASEVITLTAGAAAEVQHRWGRTCVILPHPPVLPLHDIGALRESRADPVVAIHAKALRANIDPWPVLDALLPEGGAGWRLRLDVDAEALRSPRSAEAAVTRLDRYSAAGVDIRVHPRFTDAALCEYLHDIDVMVLPYRFGTHSGWVEACYDAGVCAVVPDCGYFAQQQSFPVYHYNRSEFDAASLLRAVDAALMSEPISGAELRAQRHQLSAHLRTQMTGLYHRLLTDARVA
jgi:hypothetical protein